MLENWKLERKNKMSSYRITKQINNGGTCKYCKTKSIYYSILNGNFIYECLKCDKKLDKMEVLIIK